MTRADRGPSHSSCPPRLDVCARAPGRQVCHNCPLLAAPHTPHGQPDRADIVRRARAATLGRRSQADCRRCRCVGWPAAHARRPYAVGSASPPVVETTTSNGVQQHASGKRKTCLKVDLSALETARPILNKRVSSQLRLVSACATPRHDFALRRGECVSRHAPAPRHQIRVPRHPHIGSRCMCLRTRRVTIVVTYVTSVT